jgi:hypothetical protein
MCCAASNLCDPWPAPGGDWQFLCGSGGHSDPNEAHYIHVGHALDLDSSLDEVVDLPADWEVERRELGCEWMRSRYGAFDA